MRDHCYGFVVALGIVVVAAGCGGSTTQDGHPTGDSGPAGASGGERGSLGCGRGSGDGRHGFDRWRHQRRSRRWERRQHWQQWLGGRDGWCGGWHGREGEARLARQPASRAREARWAGRVERPGPVGPARRAAERATSEPAGARGAGNCKLPATVSFQKDVQPFLSATCGGGSGCHVIDSASTTANGGYDHAYDWITAGAHPSSCPETPTPKRFEIVMAVIAAADPATCSKSRVMPPQDETGANLRTPLTSCQAATLQAWLDEPLVTQAHRVDDTDPTGTAPFPMPPFN